MEVVEPVLIELIESPAFQRLKNIHQYGVAYYTTHREEYNRYDHSIGVFAILRANNVSLEEQIAGLLHDVSHTAFSHVGDWIFGEENGDKGYQDKIHPIFLEKSGLADILRKHNFTVEDVLPTEELFPALENSLPNLCADRIDYNIQGAYYQGFITKEEAKLVFNDLRFVDRRWVSEDVELMKKVALFSLFMTGDCWGSPTNYMTSRFLADALLRAIHLGLITYDDLHFGTDQVIWDTLLLQEDEIIRKNMEMIKDSALYFSVVEFSDDVDLVIKSKFRGIDPCIKSDLGYVRMTALDEQFAKEYEKTRSMIESGYPIKIYRE